MADEVEQKIEAPRITPPSDGARREGQFTDTTKQGTWTTATEGYRKSQKDSASMEALNDAGIERIKKNGYEKFEIVDPSAEPGPAEETGTVIDYKPTQTGEKSYALGMDYEEERDTRSVYEKLADFGKASAARATDPEGQQAYIQGQLDKIIGIGEGLIIAKDSTKAAVVAGWTALTDGTVANFLSKPNAINDPLFHAVGGALDATAKDPDAVNHALERVGTMIMQGSDRYTAAPNREKGHILGETMFAMVNPEGSTEAGQAALKVADRVATHVDKAVMDGIQKSMKAAEEMADATPELAAQAKKMLYDYTKTLSMSPQEMELAGIPKGYFDGMQPPTGTGKDDNFFAMSKADDPAEGMPRPTERRTEGEPVPEKFKPSERFVSELRQAIETLSEKEINFLSHHGIQIQPIRRVQDVMPELDKRLGGFYDPTEKTIYVAEEVWSLGQWRNNPDVMFELRHEFGHAYNAKKDPFGEWVSETAEFRAAFREDIANVSPQKLEELQLVFDKIAKTRDEVFADMYAHATGLESVNPRSIQMKQLFPKCLEHVRQERLEMR